MSSPPEALRALPFRPDNAGSVPLLAGTWRRESAKLSGHCRKSLMTAMSGTR
ncbi:hypothetical protein [Novacetimonas cocois]|uniref:hypothetical protein n=1 Tax=Novacetimonas cocois TaxID=1747507 RepID=UPI001402492E|nr:hypothetical protein [Novacetimonas cocois]